MKSLQRLMIALTVMAVVQVQAQTTQNAKMNAFVTALMKKMTLEEKLGQLNLPGAGDIPQARQVIQISLKRSKKEKWAAFLI